MFHHHYDNYHNWVLKMLIKSIQMYELLIDHLLIDHIVVVMGQLYENELNHHNERLKKNEMQRYFFLYRILITVFFSIIKTDMNN